MKIMGNYDVNYVVEVSSSTEVYIAVNYHSLHSFIPWETQCFGPVVVSPAERIKEISWVLVCTSLWGSHFFVMSTLHREC